MAEQKIVIGITQGDMNGVGYEVIIKTLMDPRILDLCTPIVYGSPKIAAFHRKTIGAENFSFNAIRTASECNHKRANIINVANDATVVALGKPTEVSGIGALNALNAAVADLKEEKINALVTAPFNKQNMNGVGYNFAGHTEFLAAAFVQNQNNVLMLMVSENLRVGVVTGHIPLAKVPGTLSKSLIVQKIKLLNDSLVKDFGFHRPRIAVLGLNPHSGDGGLLGNEENDIIIPAIGEAAKAGILAFGPYAADSFFADNNQPFEAVLAMYHDQGLAPFKALAFNTGVNFSAGLPVVRTSPVHGTAYDIAGKNQANPDSFRHAIYLACDIVKKRKEYAALTKNPMEIIQVPSTPRGN